MKKKIFASLLVIVILSTIAGIFNTSYSSVRRNAAINTVNGGEAEFIAYEQIQSKQSKTKLLVNIACIFVGVSTIGWIFKDSKSKK